MSSLRSIIAADLKANTQSSGLKVFLWGFLLSPGFFTVLAHRLARSCRHRPWRLLGELIWRYNVFQSSCYIHMDCEIGPGLRLPHPTGIVVGEGVTLGENIVLYQGVTLGQGRNSAYPVVGRDVTIFPNSIIIGPVKIGDGAIIGAGSFVSCDVPAGAVFAGNPARLIRYQDAPVAPAAP